MLLGILFPSRSAWMTMRFMHSPRISTARWRQPDGILKSLQALEARAYLAALLSARLDGWAGERGDAARILYQPRDVSRHRGGRLTGHRTHLGGVEFGLSAGCQEAVRLLARVGELRVAEARDGWTFQNCVDQLAIFGKELRGVGHSSIPMPRRVGFRAIADPAAFTEDDRLIDRPLTRQRQAEVVRLHLTYCIRQR